jgi:hypothetical protein
MKMNADGSVDLYVSPDAPAELESNWIPTMGKEPYLWFRLYAGARKARTGWRSGWGEAGEGLDFPVGSEFGRELFRMRRRAGGSALR